MTEEVADKRLLIIRTNYDQPTKIIEPWGAQISEKAKSLGYDVKDLVGKEASPELVRSTIETFDPGSIFVFSHGCPCDLFGHDGTYVVPVIGIYNASLTNHRLVSVLACWTSQCLGPACAEEHECSAYLGYEVEYGFYGIEPYLQGFKECALAPFYKLLEKSTVDEARAEGDRSGRECIKSWRSDTSLNPLLRELAVVRMERNLDGYVISGNDTTRMI